MSERGVFGINFHINASHRIACAIERLEYTTCASTYIVRWNGGVFDDLIQALPLPPLIPNRFEDVSH